MRLTSRGEYALLALVYLARQPNDVYIRTETIAAAQEIPAKFLEQILLTLKRAQYLSSQKGQHGGYRLAREAKNITLAEIIRLVDGPLAPTDSVSKYYYRRTPIQKEAALVDVLVRVRDCILDILENTSIADIS
ncbi:MAG: Rrf2 family transcriptional regulator [Anaerolineae bacterium]|nr:Rrf2 family transcriptional regulator [Anaerolineae bacterium]